MAIYENALQDIIENAYDEFIKIEIKRKDLLRTRYPSCTISSESIVLT